MNEKEIHQNKEIYFYVIHCSFSLLTNSSVASAVCIKSNNGKSSRLRFRSHFGHGFNALRHSA